MCGITLYFSRLAEKDLSRELDSSLKNLLYRGPDANATWTNNNVGLAHARLSIIDLSEAGNQPMHSEDNSLHIVFNGEIYNYKELKNELLKKGCHFSSNSDTEVILQGFKHWGCDLFTRLNGMFSLAIYDDKKEELILARDRFGIKPLYFYLDEENCFAASELAALLSYPIPRKLDHNSLSNYFKFSYIPNNKSIISGVSQLEPGSYVKINRKTSDVQSYYSISTETIDISYTEAIQEITYKLEKSVESRLIADVPVATFLSGGIDSSIITLLAADLNPGIHSYSAGFSEFPFFNEANQAEEFGSNLNIKHTILDLKQDDLLSSVDELLNAFSEPFADSSSIAYYLLSKYVSQSTKVALSGDGADELFGGYRKHKAEYVIRKYPTLSTLASKMDFLTHGGQGSRNSISGNINRQIGKWMEANKLSNEERYILWASMASKDELSSLLIRNRDDSGVVLAQLDSMNALLKQDMEMLLPSDMLYKVDRSSMLHGLEVRVPFLDHNLVDFVFSLPSEWKLRKGNRKALLKEAFKDRLPMELLARKKKGFEVPVWDWLRGPLRSTVDEVLNKEAIMEQGLLNYSKIESLLDQSRSSKPGNTPYLIWSLLVFQKWMNKYNPEI